MRLLFDIKLLHSSLFELWWEFQYNSKCSYIWNHAYCQTSNIRHILTHWGRVTHICVSKLTIIGSDNGLSADGRQATIWNNAEILLIRPLGTNFNEMSIEILTFSWMKMRLKVLSAKWRPFCLGLNVLKGKKIVDHSVGASPVGTAIATYSFSTLHLASSSLDWTKTTATWDEKHRNFGIWCDLY